MDFSLKMTEKYAMISKHEWERLRQSVYKLLYYENGALLDHLFFNVLKKDVLIVFQKYEKRG